MFLHWSVLLIVGTTLLWLWLRGRTSDNGKAKSPLVRRFRGHKIEWRANKLHSENALKDVLPVNTSATGRRYMVVGGCGCLGSHIVEALLARGEQNVGIFDLRDNHRFADDARVHVVEGDVTDAQCVRKTLEGVDTVFHTAAVIQYWASHAFQVPIHERVNHLGTRNVVDACRANGVRRLIATSTTNVVMRHTGAAIEDVDMADESAPYSDAPISPYGLTKMRAEKAVLGANDGDALMTVCLRPPGIFGPRDKTVEGNLTGGLPMHMMGTMGDQDWVYVENLVHAHLLAEIKMQPGADVNGQAFFVTNGADGYVNCGQLYTEVARALYHPHFDESLDILVVPNWLLWIIAVPMNLFHRATRGRFIGADVTKVTPITIQYVTVNLHFDDAKARRMLGYREIFTHKDAFERMRIYHHGQ
jgi:3beta-hydroxy-Delta5-steroid dehydrogenase / steroid Delta-isomerase